MPVPIPITSARSSTARRRYAGWVVALLSVVGTGGQTARLIAQQASPPSTQAGQDVIARYREALAKYPSADNHAALAWVLSRYESANAAALEHAQMALQLEPDHYKAHEIAAIILEMQGRDADVIEHLIAMMPQDRPETQYYIARIVDLTLPVPLRDKAIAALQRFITQPGREVQKATARWILAQLLLRQGRPDEARAMFDALGFVKTWRAIGPFDNEANAGFGMTYGPEGEIDLAKSYPGRGMEVSWRKLEHFTLSGLCDLEAVMYPSDQVLAYAVTFVQAPKRVDAIVRLAADQAVKLWLNDRLVLADDQDKGLALDQHVAPVVLEAGWNKLLVKVCRHGGKWRFALRLTDPQAAALAGLNFADEPKPAPKAASSNPSGFAYQGGALTHFGNEVAKDREKEASVYYLGLSQMAVNRRAPAAQTFEWLASLNKHCSEYRLRLALAYWIDEKPDKAFEQLKETLALEPDNLTALALLGRFYRSRDSLEQARKTLDAAVAVAPDAVAGHLELQQLYGQRGWQYQTYLTAKTLYERHPRISALADNYARQCDAYGYRQEARALWSQALAEDASNVTACRALLDLDARENRIDDALRQCDALQRLLPLDHSIRGLRVDLLLRAKRYEPAVAVCEEVLKICPTHAGFHTRLGGIYERMGRANDAILAWRSALRYKPDDQRLRDYLQFLQPEHDNPVFAKFGVGAEEAQGIVKTTKVAEADYPKADAVVLLDHRVTQLFEDGSSTSQEHGICKILNERGRRQYTKIPLSGQNHKVLRAVVIMPDGSEIEATQIAGDAIHFAKLQPGSIVEYKVIYYRGGTSWLSRHFMHVALFQSAYPILRAQWILVAPKTREVRFVVRGRHIKETRGEFQDQVVREFRADNVPMVEPEVVRPPLADIVEQVRCSTIPNWDEIARWEWALMKDQFESDSAIREKVKILTAGARTPGDRLRAIYNFVTEKIQYKVLNTSAIFGVKPPKAANVLANEWGDCKGKSVLLITMLKEAGIDARYATLRSRDSGRLIRELPSNQCNHAIVYVPAADAPDDPKRGRWLDATAEYHGVDSLPWSDRGVEAIVWDAQGRMSFQTIDQVQPSANVIEMTVEASLSDDASARVRVNWNATGQFAAGMRQQFRRTGRRQQQLEGVVTSLQPGGQLTDMTFSDLMNRDQPVEIRFDYKAAQYAERAGTRLILRPKRRFELTERYAPRTERHYDVWLPMPSIVEYSEVYRFPPSWAIQSLPQPARLDTPWMSYKLQCTGSPGQVRIDKKLVIKTTDIPKSEYARLREFCIAADKHEQKTVTLGTK